MADVLIIDDDAEVRRLIIRILIGAGHTVREAQNGEVGVRMFREARPSLVITDILMPEREGIETIRELRRETPAVPILAISGGCNFDYLTIAMHFGADAKLAKPFSPAELLNLVAELLERSARG